MQRAEAGSTAWLAAFAPLALKSAAREGRRGTRCHPVIAEGCQSRWRCLVRMMRFDGTSTVTQPRVRPAGWRQGELQLSVLILGESLQADLREPVRWELRSVALAPWRHSEITTAGTANRHWLLVVRCNYGRTDLRFSRGGRVEFPATHGSPTPVEASVGGVPNVDRPNPSIERTFQRPLRALWPAAHVER